MALYIRMKNLNTEQDFADAWERLKDNMIPEPIGLNKEGEETFISRNNETVNIITYKKDGFITLTLYDKNGKHKNTTYSGKWNNNGGF